ncbi:hypothetical protein [Listeria newyorkensis]|uniref:Uncharacterized protein n=1 Tax=Listeria newyorkensis TaxID=1497681 RepID=A0A841YSJ3_9LIST|nr:hypothetical protein [Listeria newyorkensis]MBC1456248.1 hypothetical protein [Listeria newyorkensis]
MLNFILGVGGLIPLGIILLFLITLIANQIFNTEIERTLYSNLEKFVFQILAIIGVAVILFLLMYLASDPEEIDTDKLSTGGQFTFIASVLLFCALYFYFIYRVLAYLSPKPIYYFRYEGGEYSIIKRHRKNVWLCHDEKSDEWKFFTEDKIFNQVALYKIPVEDAQKKLVLKLYKKHGDLPKIAKIYFVFCVVLLSLYFLASLIITIGYPISQGTDIKWVDVVVSNVFWLSIMVMVIPILVTYRQGRKLFKKEQEANKEVLA